MFLDVHRCPQDILRCFRDVRTMFLLKGGSLISYTYSVKKKTAKKTNDPKGTSIGRMDFDNQEVYSDTSIFDGLVLQGARPA